MYNQTAMTETRTPGTKTARQRAVHRNLVAYSFIAPNFIIFAAFTLVPLVFAFILAFLNWDGSNHITVAGLDNFIRLLDDDRFITSLINTFLYTLGTVPLTMATALALAVLLNRKLPGKNFFRTVAFFPYVASLIAVAIVWNMIFNPSMGPVNMLLSSLGVTDLPGWAADKNWAMLTVIFFSVWKNMGYYMIIYLAGLQGISPELYEAAELDGSNGWAKFRYITLPQLWPTNFFVLIILTIQCFKVFDQIYMITQAGPGTSTLVLVLHIYQTAFISWNLGYASALSLVLFVIVLTITVIQFRAERKLS